MTASSFPELLAEQLRADPSRPLVTFYDDATGERVELSVLTYLNWVNKTASLLQDELDVERGDLLLVDLPTHWLGAVWLGAAWTHGAAVTNDPAFVEEAALVVCGPQGLGRYAVPSTPAQVVATSLRPLGARFLEPLPEGTIDYGAVVLAQPDAYTSFDPPGGDDEAWRRADGSLTQAELLASRLAEPLVEPGGRLLTDLNPCSEPGLGTLLSPLARGGGTVWVAHPDEAGWERRRAAERATAELRVALP